MTEDSRLLTLDDLRRILHEAAGADEIGPTDDILDREFAELGYDSIALLECSGRIEREFLVTLADDTVAEAPTPRALLDIVNAEIASAGTRAR